MSFDLHLATHYVPDQHQIYVILERQPGVAVTGTLRDDDNIVVWRSGPNGTVPLLTIDGAPTIPEDLPEPLGDVVNAARWRGFISVPEAGQPDGVHLAQLVARSLAEQCEGAVYDPQSDEVILPQGSRQRAGSLVQEERIAVLDLEWVFPRVRVGGDTPQSFLDIVRRTFPEAAPKSYDGHRLKPGTEDEFYAFWHKEATRGLLATMWEWKAERPSFGGSVFIRQKANYPVPGTLSVWGISMSFDARRLMAETRRREAAVDLFVAMATELGAFYAAGYINRNLVATRRELYSDSKTEGQAITRWWGLPDFPTWLAWFGAPYANEVAGALRGAPIEERGDGLFLRMSEKPMNADELRDVFPVLPPHLIGTDERAAQWIPPIE